VHAAVALGAAVLLLPPPTDCAAGWNELARIVDAAPALGHFATPAPPEAYLPKSVLTA
jgi:hypothetical protein